MRQVFAKGLTKKSQSEIENLSDLKKAINLYVIFWDPFYPYFMPVCLFSFQFESAPVKDYLFAPLALDI